MKKYYQHWLSQNIQAPRHQQVSNSKKNHRKTSCMHLCYKLLKWNTVFYRVSVKSYSLYLRIIYHNNKIDIDFNCFDSVEISSHLLYHSGALYVPPLGTIQVQVL